MLKTIKHGADNTLQKLLGGLGLKATTNNELENVCAGLQPRIALSDKERQEQISIYLNDYTIMMAGGGP